MAVRVLLIAAAALALVGAAKPQHVDYRLTVEPQPSGPAVLDRSSGFALVRWPEPQPASRPEPKTTTEWNRRVALTGQR